MKKQEGDMGWSLEQDFHYYKKSYEANNYNTFEHSKSNLLFAMKTNAYKQFLAHVQHRDLAQALVYYELGIVNNSATNGYNFLLIDFSNSDCEAILFSYNLNSKETQLMDVQVDCNSIDIDKSIVGKEEINLPASVNMSGEGLPFLGLIKISSNKVFSRNGKIVNVNASIPNIVNRMKLNYFSTVEGGDDFYDFVSKRYKVVAHR